LVCNSCRGAENEGLPCKNFAVCGNYLTKGTDLVCKSCQGAENEGRRCKNFAVCGNNLSKGNNLVCNSCLGAKNGCWVEHPEKKPDWVKLRGMIGTTLSTRGVGQSGEAVLNELLHWHGERVIEIWSHTHELEMLNKRLEKDWTLLNEALELFGGEFGEPGRDQFMP
jgi:hypothetical protein